MSTPLEVAIKEIGVSELTGNNDGVPSERYMGGKREPWCAHFVCWCFAQAGKPIPGYIPSRAPDPSKGIRERWNPYASVAALMKFCQDRGCFFPAASAKPAPGDLMFLSERGKSDTAAAGAPLAKHIGIVRLASAMEVTTVDGNWGNKVMEVTRKPTDPTIIGYARLVL